jgi:hypothetical protein
MKSMSKDLRMARDKEHDPCRLTLCNYYYTNLVLIFVHQSCEGRLFLFFDEVTIYIGPFFIQNKQHAKFSLSTL